MTQKSLARLAWGGMAALLLTGIAATAQSQTFAIYDGKIGYQELAISADTYYLAFHGNRDTSGPWVDAAWGVRAAQLCAAKGANAFVALRYIDEAVLEGDVAMAMLDATPGAVIKVAAGPVYIPIFLPSGPRNASVDAAGKSGPVRCLNAGAALRNPTRAVKLADALEAGRKVGVPAR